tara:strand:+ start:623 stop:739 length:117 start_codon:yes stop_codon:yes gene_type:complete
VVEVVLVVLVALHRVDLAHLDKQEMVVLVYHLTLLELQ